MIKALISLNIPSDKTIKMTVFKNHHIITYIFNKENMKILFLEKSGNFELVFAGKKTC